MASFKTAYLQRELLLDVAVKGTVNTGDATQSAAGKAYALRVANPSALTAILVGDLVKLTAAATETTYSYKATAYDATKVYTDAAALPDPVVALSPQYLKVGVGEPYSYYEKVTTVTDYPAYVERVLSLANATHIAAQSDTTLEYGHVPVENRDYRYFPSINGTFASSVAATSATKKVALFLITDKSDVIIDAEQGETL